ncbi:hypothetical protein FEE95_10800 [Maribacter algarum]|uniref:YD repeat-containing protein n=1 Tax=Maribacter algarum (ex Zhang et al. 2020) TaxID=2578118 RepID=A0A5S3PQK6_9FLAO|nr:hypothetical protein [Maribacter algarum]TMM56974.1 hypothetical protein FEE95_10800 [Maribacter algarum]
MVKKYTVLFLIVLMLFPLGMNAQEIQIFSVADFDLKGSVKSCLVSTKYGKEEYDFNEEGLLSKSVTRYNDADYDITYYKYSKGMLLEKRLENYRDNVFDKSTSIASFYTIDSLLNLKITEKIISYNKEFLDQYEYFFKNDSIFKIVHTNDSGIDETFVTYTDVKGEQTQTYTLSGVVQKTVRTSVIKEQDSIISRNVLTRKFLDGVANSALEENFDGADKLISSTKFFRNPKTRKLANVETAGFAYDESGVLSKIEIQVGKVLETKEYIYQFDENGNWIKEIITPDNTYKTRKISYYESIAEVKEE